MFIELTLTKDNKKIIINASNICSAHPYEKGGTLVFFPGGVDDFIVVNEELSRVIDKLTVKGLFN